MLVPSAAGECRCPPAILGAWRASRLSARNSCGAARAGRWAFRVPQGLRRAIPAVAPPADRSARPDRRAAKRPKRRDDQQSDDGAGKGHRVAGRQPVQPARDELNRPRGRERAPGNHAHHDSREPVSRRIIAISVPSFAPSALRMPISLVRLATPDQSTPYTRSPPAAPRPRQTQWTASPAADPATTRRSTASGERAGARDGHPRARPARSPRRTVGQQRRSRRRAA